MALNRLSETENPVEDLFDDNRPVLLFEFEDHAVYWLGISEETIFRCNVYLIKSGDETILVDPGGHKAFPQVFERTSQLVDPEQVSGLILCHQDPDVAGSLPDWLDVNEAINVFSTPRTHVLLPHYGRKGYAAFDVEANATYQFGNGKKLHFYSAPFLHFPGAFTTYDETSGFLFSGDIWAALDTDWHLVVQSFADHIPKMDLFHKDYMACNIASRGFVNSISMLDIQGILPQHGSLIRRHDVPAALVYLKDLQCGLDLIYSSDIEGIAPVLPDAGADEQEEYVDMGLLIPEDELTVLEEDELLLRKARLLDQALRQSERLAAMKDKALRDLKVAERALEELARLDGLLRIPNRRSFDEYFEQEWRRAVRYKAPISLLMIDIDHFKLYNDHYGHQAGDKCLAKVASLIRSCLHRSTDMVARYGGEEFACILPDTTATGSLPVARAIMQAVQSAKIEHAAISGQVTLSIGVATAVPTVEGKAELLVKEADTRLYEAKSSGRRRLVSEFGEEIF